MQSTLILRRDTGVIIHADGSITAGDEASSLNPNVVTAGSPTEAQSVRANPSSEESAGPDQPQQPAGHANGPVVTRAQQLANMALRFTSVAGDLATTLDREGEEKEKVGLLRMRTGKSEVIIVPGQSKTVAPSNYDERIDPLTEDRSRCEVSTCGGERCWTVT